MSKRKKKKSQSKPQAQTKAKSQSKPQAQTKAESQTKAKSQSKPQAQIKAEPQAKAKVQTKPQAQTKIELQTKEKSQIKPQAQTKAEPQTKAKVQSKPPAQIKAKPQTKTKSQSKLQEQSESQTKAKSQSKSQAQTKVESQIKAKSQTKPKPQSKQQAQTKINSQSKPQTRTKPEGKGRRKKQKNNDWREIIYNCPYLLAVVITSLVVMIYSDKIGFRAIAREAEMTIVQTMGVNISTQEMDLDQATDPVAKDGENLEILSENEQIETDNAGECKEENDDIWNENNLNKDDETEEYQENTEENVRGVTKFETYEPQETESRYYSDAGKVALTTEYPYSIESDSYFNDAVFLGDSRTLGISDYAGLEDADFYCDSGMTIFKILDPEGVTYQKTGDKVDLSQVLQEKQYGKIYIMLGMNELGYGNTQMYFEQYNKVVNQIREWQPEAIIYIMANLHVSEAKNNAETEFNNININDKNVASARLANGRNIFYLDANPLFTDENGFLKAELSFDGVHLYAQHYDVWRQFLLEHAVESAEKQETVPGEDEAEQEHTAEQVQNSGE